MAGEKPKQNRIHFTRDDILDLIGLVINENPFSDPEKWIAIVATLKERRLKDFTMKNVREKVLALIKDFRERDTVLQVTSGREEGYDELEQRLQIASDLKKEFADGTPFVKRRKSIKKTVNPGKEARLEAALRSFPVQVEEACSSEMDTGTILDIVTDHSYVFSLSDPINAPDDEMKIEEVIEEVQNPKVDKLQIPAITAPTPAQPSCSVPRERTSSNLINSVRTPVTSVPRKKLKRQFEDECWKKLEADRELQLKKIELEKLKTENEKRKQEIDYEVEMKRLKLQEHQLNLMKEQAELMASTSQNWRKNSEEERAMELRKIKLQEDQITLTRQLNEHMKDGLAQMFGLIEKLLEKNNP